MHSLPATLLLCIWIAAVTSAAGLPPVLFSSHSRGAGGEWIFTSLASLLLASEQEQPEIHIMVGGLDSSYLDNLKHHRSLYIHPLDSRAEQLWSKKRGNWRGGWNYVRCLNASSAEAGVLIAEDDVIFVNDFWTAFRRVQASIEADFPGQDYVLDLYARFSKAPRDRERLYTPKARSFCCTQCMYYTAGAAAAVQAEMSSNLKGVKQWGYDMSIKRVLQQKRLLMFNAYPTLVQHIGVHSSIGSLHFHRSSHFQPGNPHSLYTPTGSIHYNKTATLLLLHQKLRQRQSIHLPTSASLFPPKEKTL